ncbi:MAG: Ig-like domain-containing protein [Acidimicrobiia bacterium]|nr:Ig-like domain-containing protein [Acidimicrobiia bacterium]
MSEPRGPTTGNAQAEDRWRERRLLAALLRGGIFMVPLVVGFLTGKVVAAALPETTTAADVATWWVAVIGSSMVAATVTDRLARKLLPLTLLLKMTMLFPDRAPSRMRVALRSGNFTELRKRISAAQTGANSDVGEMSELILSLSTALSQHDRKTRGHSERTRAYTDILAEEMGLGEEDRDRLRWAALLHDVGKLEVPAEILNKDGKLTDHEWSVVKQHPVFGMKLVAPLIPWLGPWAKTIEHHHERYDGTGYPHGLAGEDISLGARIVSVADAYDVMTSGRAYQRAKTPAAARSEIAKLAGQQFDPIAVRALMNVSLGRLRWATGPIAVLAELPFIRGLPQLGRDAATLLTSSAVMATSMAVGVLPPPADLIESDFLGSGSILALPHEGSDEPAPAPNSTASAPGQNPPTTRSTETDPDGEPGTADTTIPPGDGSPTTSTTAPPPTTLPAPGAPLPYNDAATTREDTAVTLDVLANDTDPDGDLVASTLAVVGQPEHGRASVSGSRVSYTPDPDFNGSDRFDYRICDSEQTCSSARATVDVSPVNDLPTLQAPTLTVNEEGLLTVSLKVVDIDGDDTTCELEKSPKVGVATVPADCTKLVYQTAENFNGEVAITIRVSDGHGASSFPLVIQVTPVNDMPVAADISDATDWVTTIDVPVVFPDSDVDGDPLTVIVLQGPAFGNVTVVGGSLRYTPAFGMSGTTTVIYRLCDPGGLCDDGTVTLTVAAITIARDDSGSTNPGGNTTVRVIANDVPASGDWHPPSFRITTQPTGGDARTMSGGRIRYSARRDFTGTDTIGYEVCDTAGSCDTAELTIVVG